MQGDTQGAAPVAQVASQTLQLHHLPSLRELDRLLRFSSLDRNPEAPKDEPGSARMASEGGEMRFQLTSAQWPNPLAPSPPPCCCLRWNRPQNTLKNKKLPKKGESERKVSD